MERRWDEISGEDPENTVKYPRSMAEDMET